MRELTPSGRKQVVFSTRWGPLNVEQMSDLCLLTPALSKARGAGRVWSMDISLMPQNVLIFVMKSACKKTDTQRS